MNKPLPNSFRAGPDDNGRFGIFGGRFVAETLMPLILDLEQAYAQAKNDPSFHHELEAYISIMLAVPHRFILQNALQNMFRRARLPTRALKFISSAMN